METRSFADLHISEEILHAIKDMGFEEATPIQSDSIPVVLEGRDIIAQSQTGSGKTASFGIPILERTDSDSRQTQALILCPTRELALQVADEIKELGKYKKKLRILAVYGGQSIERQYKMLDKGVQIIVGTPGRVRDHIQRGSMNLENLQSLTLDEADIMLDMGFRDDLEFIFNRTPADRQTILFSATMPAEIVQMSRKYMDDPHTIKIAKKFLQIPQIEQYYIETRSRQKMEILCRLLDVHNFASSIVFCNTKRMVDEVTDHLLTRGYVAEGLHGDMKQAQRDRVMKKFRDGVIDNLVATDVAARGIDVDDMEAVFNYDFPQDEDYYVHRIGRTGRAGKTGKAFNLISSQDFYRLRSVMRTTKSKINRLDPPSLADVERKRDEVFFEKVKHEITEGHLGKYVTRIERMMGDEYTSMDVAAALLKLATGGEEQKDKVTATQDFGETGASPGMVRLFINVGRQQNVGVRDIIGAIAGETGVAGKLIGSIDLYDRFTFVEVPKDQAAEILSIMKTVRIKGNDINIEPAQKKDGDSEGNSGRSERRGRDRGGKDFGGGKRDRGGRDSKRFRKRSRFEG